jgi:hypothetical protein
MFLNYYPKSMPGFSLINSNPAFTAIYITNKFNELNIFYLILISPGKCSKLNAIIFLTGIYNIRKFHPSTYVHEGWIDDIEWNN